VNIDILFQIKLNFLGDFMDEVTEARDSILGILQSAISIEKFGYRYYMALSGATQNEEGKSLLDYLASSEKEHQRKLENMFNIQIGIGEEATKPLPLDNLDEDGRLAIFSEHLDELDPTEVGPIKALNFGIHIEIKSIVFYKSASKVVDNIDVKETFLDLIEFENEHLELLQRNLKELESSGNWAGRSDTE
jgi:rubrerythrin